MPVGMFRSTISSSDIWSRCLTSARRELPCATISTVLPNRKSGTMTSVKYGRNRALGRGAAADVGVAGVGVLAEFAPPFDRRWRGVVAAPPGHELFFAVAGLGLGLVQPLQRAIVAFVEPPAAPHRNPQPVGGVQ